MNNRIANDMISSGMIPSGEKKKEDLSRTQYGSAPSPSKLMDAYKSMYDKKEEVINEMAGEGMGAAPAPKPGGITPYKDPKKAGGITPYKKPETKSMVDTVKDRRKEVEDKRGITARREKVQDIMNKYGESVDLLAAYRAVYEHHKKDADGNTIPHEDEEVNEGKIPAGLQAYLDKKKGKKEDKKDMKEDVDLFDVISDKLIEEGYSKEESYKIMSNLTKEQLEEINEALVSGTLATLGLIGTKLLGGAKAAAVAGKGLASAGKAVAAKGMSATKTAMTGVKNVAQTGMSKATKALSKVSNIAKDKAKGMGDKMTNMGKSVGDDVKNEIKRKIIQGDDGGSNKITKTGTMSAGSYQAASADLFDIVKGQLLDEGLSEEEIKDIMLTLTPDEILNEMGMATPESGTGKYYDEKNPTPKQKEIQKNLPQNRKPTPEQQAARDKYAKIRDMTNKGDHQGASKLYNS